jgi:hypothetical protein
MSRVLLYAAHVFGANRVRAGKTIADTVANSVPGDVIVGPLTSSSVTGIMSPLDGAATALKGGSPYSGAVMPCTISGAASIDA